MKKRRKGKEEGRRGIKWTAGEEERKVKVGGGQEWQRRRDGRKGAEREREDEKDKKGTEEERRTNTVERER